MCFSCWHTQCHRASRCRTLCVCVCIAAEGMCRSAQRGGRQQHATCRPCLTRLVAHARAQNLVACGAPRAEEAEPVRRALVATIASICRKDLPSNAWPALLPFLHQSTLSTSAQQRAAAMELFQALTEQVPGALRAHAGELQPVFARGLGDSDVRVQRTSLKAASAFVGVSRCTACVFFVPQIQCVYTWRCYVCCIAAALAEGQGVPPPVLQPRPDSFYAMCEMAEQDAQTIFVQAWSVAQVGHLR